MPPNPKPYNREYRRAWRLRVLMLLGGRCERCDFDDMRALEIDHVQGGSSRDGDYQDLNYSRKVMLSFLRGENKYQLLCANHNKIKRYEAGEGITLER